MVRNSMFCSQIDGFIRQKAQGLGFWVLILCGLFLVRALLPGPVLAQSSSAPTSSRLALPRTTLNQPVDDHIFLAGFGALGGGLEFKQGQIGYGGVVVFRPGRATRFFSALYDWRASFLIQADYQKLSATSRIFSGDFVIRHYFRDLETLNRSSSPFLGFGVGASEVELPAGGEDRFQKTWSWLLELGQEWTIQDRYLVFAKGQYRRCKEDGYDFTSWSFQAGAGIDLD